MEPNRESDCEIGAREDDKMLQPEKKQKKKKPKPVVISPVAGATEPHGQGNRVTLVSPSDKEASKSKKNSETKTTSDNSSLSTAAVGAPSQAPTTSGNEGREESFASTRRRKTTPAPIKMKPGLDSPKPPAWSHVFQVTPSNVQNHPPPDNPSASPTMERYLNDQYRQWSAQSEAGDPPNFPYLPPVQKTWTATQASLIPPLTTFTLYDGKVSKTLPEISDIRSRWSRGLISDDEEEQSPLNPLRRVTYAKEIDVEKSRKPDKRRRVVEKDGRPNVEFKNISERRRRYISDFYTTLVDSSWPGTLFLFAMSFFVSWLFFAVIYYVISLVHGDLEPGHLPANQSESGWKPCIWEIEDFSSCYLFSVETQHTIGYGSRQTTNLCVSAMIAMSFQSIVGCLIQAFMVGLVFAKLSRPKQRSRTVVFSKQAVVCERNKRLCLQFRVGDMRDDSFIVNAQISVKVIRRKVTEEGEMFYDVSPIKITPDSSSEPCVFMVWPFTLVHEIDETSPFYRHSAADLMRDKFEIHVALEGTIESTSMNFQARTSYLPHEICWGHRFEPMMLYRKDHSKYQINFSAFHSTFEVDTPICSSHDLEQYYKAKEQHQKSFGDHLSRSLPNTSAPPTLKKSATPSLAPSNHAQPPLPKSLPPTLQVAPQFNFTAESERSDVSDSSDTSSTKSGEITSDFKDPTLNSV